MAKPMASIYLAGPIAGCNYAGATDWREYVREHMPDSVLVRSPMRDIVPVSRGLAGTVAARYEESPLSSSRGIMARDRNDVICCDVVLANLLGATRVSIGTVMELGWADMLRKPVVLVMEAGNLHEHEMVREACPFIVGSLDEGIKVMCSILGLWNEVPA